MSVLLIAEHNNKEVRPFTYNAITAASQINDMPRQNRDFFLAGAKLPEFELKTSYVDVPLEDLPVGESSLTID